MLTAVVVLVGVLGIVTQAQKRAALQEKIDSLETVYEISIHDNGEGGKIIGSSSSALTDLRGFADALTLRHQPVILDLTGANELTSLAGIEAFTQLESLVMIDCPKLSDLSALSAVKSLREIIITDGASLPETVTLADFPVLETVDFSGSASVKSLQLVNTPLLNNLYASRCQSLTSLTIEGAPALRQLTVDNCQNLAELPDLSQFPQLTDLDVSNVEALTELTGLSSLQQLIVLDLRNFLFQQWDDLASLSSLSALRMGGHEDLKDLKALSGLASLRGLHIEACLELKSLEGIPSGLTEYLGVVFCPQLTTVAGIAAAPELREVTLTGCDQLQDISELSQLPELTQLSLAKCPLIRDLAPIVDLPELVVVGLAGSGVSSEAAKKIRLANPKAFFDFELTGL